MIFLVLSYIVVTLCDDCCGALITLLRQDERHDETVQTEGLSENKNEDHSNEESLLLAHGAHSSVTDDADGHTGSQATAERRARGERVIRWDEGE